MKPRALERATVAACVAGILVSTYALYVEMAIETVPGYKALCDISEHASCSRVLSSKLGGLKWKNSGAAVLFYLSLAVHYQWKSLPTNKNNENLVYDIL